jgi:hypothetical protein
MLAALAGDLEISTCPVDVVEPQTGSLAGTQATPHQDHDERPVPRPERGGRIAHAQQGRDLLGVHTPRQRSPCPGRLEDPGTEVPIEVAGAQRPPQQAADRPDDMSTSNNAVRASTLRDVRVDHRRVQTPPLHRPVSRGQHVQKAGRVATTGRDGLLSQAALLTHPQTPVRYRGLRRRKRIRLDHSRTQISRCGQEPAHCADPLHHCHARTISGPLDCEEPGEQILVDVIDPGARQLHPPAQPFQHIHDPGRRTRRITQPSQPIRTLTQHHRRQRAHRNTRDPNRIRPGRRRSLRHGPHLQTIPCPKRDLDYATMPTFCTSTPPLTCTIARTVGIFRGSA